MELKYILYSASILQYAGSDYLVLMMYTEY